MNSEENRTYYLRAITETGTRVGRYSISPKMPPTELPESEYRRLKRQIDHYVNAGIISVVEPGSKAEAKAAREIKKDKQRRDAASARGKVPLPAIGVPVNVQTAMQMQIANQQRESQAQASMDDAVAVFADDDDDLEESRCTAVTRSGNRCKNLVAGDMIVCGFHRKMLEQGKELYDESGDRISGDGTSVEGDA